MDTRESRVRGVDLEQARQKAQALLAEIRKGKALLRLGQRILTDRRFQLGELLATVRKQFPSSGKRAGGWGLFCRDLGLKRATAARYIEIAEQVAARPELADRRSFLDIYIELGINTPPPRDRFATAAVANVLPAPTLIPDPVLDEEPDDLEDAEAEGEDDPHEVDSQRGRPPLSDRERRDDIYMVRLNTDETILLRHLSGLLALRDAEVFREGLHALKEREAKKAAPLLPKVGPVLARKAR